MDDEKIEVNENDEQDSAEDQEPGKVGAWSELPYHEG